MCAEISESGRITVFTKRVSSDGSLNISVRLIALPRKAPAGSHNIQIHEYFTWAGTIFGTNNTALFKGLHEPRSTIVANP